MRDDQWDWMYKTMPMGHSTLSVKMHRKHIPANQQLYINETKSQAKLGWSLVSWLVYFHGWPITFPEVASLILCHERQKCKHLMPSVKRPRHARSRVVGSCIVGCLLFVPSQSIQASQTEVQSSLPNRHSLFLSSLSLCGLSLPCLSHTHYRNIYICFTATENSSVFNLCCLELVQHNHIHSIRWPFTHPFTCKHTHIQPFTHTTGTCYHTTTHLSAICTHRYPVLLIITDKLSLQIQCKNMASSDKILDIKFCCDRFLLLVGDDLRRLFLIAPLPSWDIS